MYIYKLTRITFNDGTSIEPGNLTVIIGPNNSGKSRAMKDIVAKTTQLSSQSGVVVSNVEWILPQSIKELCEVYNINYYLDPTNNSWRFRTLDTNLNQEFQMDINTGTTIQSFPEWLEDSFQNENTDKNKLFIQYFGKAMVAFLSTENRLQLVKESPSSGHLQEMANVLQALYSAGTSTEKYIRQMGKQGFNQEIALDFTTLKSLLIRLGDNFNEIPPDPRDAALIINQYEKLDEQGDGIRSFVGILITLLGLKRNLFLIDEPEAFLHPPQAFRIGQFIAGDTSNSRQIILTTHSTDVLQGILSKTKDVTILRIDRKGNNNYFRPLDPKRLKEIINDPLLSSARVLDGLFYSGAVVVEADSDARFYHAVSNKFQANTDFHFVNADNKQTVPRITKMYRDMGVRCVGIVDFDVLNKLDEFQKQLEALELSDEEMHTAITVQKNIAQAAKDTSPDQRLESANLKLTELLESINDVQNKTYPSDKQGVTEKNQILQRIDRKCREISDSTKDWKLLKEKGRAALPQNIQIKFDSLEEICNSKGLFINPCGELESMLTQYAIEPTSDKRKWILQALQLLPELIVNEQNYPWKFVNKIHKYLLDSLSEAKITASSSPSNSIW